MKQFLPISRADMQAQGIEQLDFVYVIGDAYVDHPSFGHAIISRILQANGFSVGIISQPDWKNPDSISILGEPKIGFIVTGGNMDSMSIIIPYLKNAVRKMRLRRAESWAGGRITQPWYTAISSAAPTNTHR